MTIEESKRPEPPYELLEFGVATMGEDGDCGACLMLGDTVVVGLNDFKTRDEARDEIVKLFRRSLGYVMGQFHMLDSAGFVTAEGEDADPSEAEVEVVEAPEPDPILWNAAWAEDIAEGNLLRVPHGPFGGYEHGIVNRVRKGYQPKADDDLSGSRVQYVSQIDPTICVIWNHIDVEDCPGHHYYGQPRSQVWIGTKNDIDVPTTEE